LQPDIPAGAASHIHFADLIANADPIVQAVMALLAFASVICWAIVLEKIVRFSGFGRQVSRFERAVNERSAEPGKGAWLSGAIIEAARRQEFSPEESRSEIEGALEKAMRLAARTELNRLQPRLRFLATVGSTAPFVGLFGTVWGIMNSFTAIAQQKDTSLAVVAPGIAEALFATALGLVAAIPAVVAYNQLSGSFARISERVNMAIAALANVLVQNAMTRRAD
jgi:biopolymer transport protein ExbB/TolQ